MQDEETLEEAYKALFLTLVRRATANKPIRTNKPITYYKVQPDPTLWNRYAGSRQTQLDKFREEQTEEHQEEQDALVSQEGFRREIKKVQPEFAIL
jgi:hypothetical protein